MTTYGYARVSSRDQNLSRQLIALSEWGVESKYCYTDKASGKDFQRPAYQKLIRKLKPGDVLVIKSIDRLGRNYDEVLSEWRGIVKDRGADIVVLDMPLLDTRKTVNGVTGALLSDIVLELLSYVAHIERENNKQRQAEGIAAAKERGVRFGRPKVDQPDDWAELKARICQGELSRVAAAKLSNVSEATVRRWLKQEC